MVGKRHWEAARLSATIVKHWGAFEADQFLSGAGDPFDLLHQIRFARFLNVAFHWLTRNADEKELFKFKAVLEQPPRWADPDAMDEETARANAAAFMAAASAGGKGVRSAKR